MNRAERRKARKNKECVLKDPVFNLKTSYILKIKKDSTAEATGKAFLLMMGLPVMVLHDKFGFGHRHCERFVDALLQLYDSFEKGYVSLDDVRIALDEECGIQILEKG